MGALTAQRGAVDGRSDCAGTAQGADDVAARDARAELKT